MSRYDWKDLLRRWEMERMTTEQAVGQLLIWAQEIDGQIGRLATQLDQLQRRQLVLSGQVRRMTGSANETGDQASGAAPSSPDAPDPSKSDSD